MLYQSIQINIPFESVQRLGNALLYDEYKIKVFMVDIKDITITELGHPLQMLLYQNLKYRFTFFSTKDIDKIIASLCQLQKNVFFLYPVDLIKRLGRASKQTIKVSEALNLLIWVHLIGICSVE